MGQGLGELMALLRSAHLAVGLPAAISFANRTINDLNRAYDQAVEPIIGHSIADPAERDRVSGALRAMSLKVGMAMLSFAQLTGYEQQLEVSALAGAVSRLYDDLIDGNSAPGLDSRLSDLFSARPFTTESDMERLLGEFIHEIRSRVQPSETAVAALNSLHEYQSLSRRQREDGVPEAVLEKICRGKGAMANLTICSLLKPEMDASEQELVMALGEAFQSLDDYMDIDQDNRNGVTTLAALGCMSLTDISQRVCELRPRMAAYYGAAPTRRYCGMIYFLLLKTVVDSTLPVVGRITRRLIQRSSLVIFVTPGVEVVPAAHPKRKVN